LTRRKEIAILIGFREYPERAGGKGAAGGKSPGKYDDFPLLTQGGRCKLALYWIQEIENRRVI